MNSVSVSARPACLSARSVTDDLSARSVTDDLLCNYSVYSGTPSPVTGTCLLHKKARVCEVSKCLPVFHTWISDTLCSHIVFSRLQLVGPNSETEVNMCRAVLYCRINGQFGSFAELL